jgi:two-component system, chemotaxis family, response regulator Rcp1
MNRSTPSEPVRILLVEDSPGDIRLTREVLRDAKIANELHIVGDGERAMAFLRREGDYAGVQRPDLILLDLNLPRKDGREVLAELNEDPELHLIPVIVLTTSAAEQDVLRSYDLKAACYITKPIDLDEFISVVRSIEAFWLSIVRLPHP